MNEFFYQYAWGNIASFFATGLIWSFLFWIHLKAKNDYSFGGFLIAIGFFAMAWRSYQFFIQQGNTATDDIMISVFISSVTFLTGSITVALPYIRHDDKL